VRARAIENQVFVIAPDQCGASTAKLTWHGRSMIVDPWGVVLAQAPDRECFVVADLDLAAQADVRRRVPSLANRRPDVYGRPVGGSPSR
jgi:predicted amidohydrolase